MRPALLRTFFWSALVAALVVALLPQPLAAGTSDKVQHAVAFAALTMLGGLAYARTRAWKLAAGMVAFGLLIELLQALPFVGRHGDPLDWLADLAGIAAALFALTLWRPRSEALQPRRQAGARRVED